QHHLRPKQYTLSVITILGAVCRLKTTNKLINPGHLMVDCQPISQISRMVASKHGRTELKEQPDVLSGEVRLKQGMNDITKVARLNLTALLGRRSRLFLSSVPILGLVFASCMRYFCPP